MSNEFEVNTIGESQTPTGLLIPRWIVYFQGAMLGVVAATFFVFGMMVGTVTNREAGQTVNQFVGEISGTVRASQRNGLEPDDAAIVLLLPEGKRVAERISPKSIHPRSFEPLGNPVIDLVANLGGAVTRTDEKGRFQVQVEGPETYTLLVISNQSQQKSPQPLSKRQKAELANVFRPVEDLIGEQQFSFSRIIVDQPKLTVPPIAFN